MFGKKFRKTLLTFCLAVVIGLFLSGLPTRVIAQQSHLQVQEQAVRNQPPASLALHQNNDRRRLPGRREPAAGRGCEISDISIPKPPMTALIPETNLGFTSAAYPQFFFYIPQMSSAKALNFALIKEDTQRIYKKTFAIPSTSGIFNISLPADQTLPPLKVGKDYHWYFQIICSEIETGNSHLEGWVKRVEPNSTPVSQLERNAPRENASGDPKNQFWYDAITTLAKKRRANPENAAISAEWENLLRSEGLENIAQMPLVGSLAGGGS